MGSTTVQAPAPRDIAQEATDTLETQIRLAPDQLAAYQRTAPEYARTDINILGQSLFGNNWTGNLTDINRRLTDEAAAQTTAANTAQRAADLADVQRFSPEVSATQRAANPELFGNLARLDSAAAAGVQPGAAGSAFLSSAMRGSGVTYQPEGYQAQSYRPERVSDQMSAVDGPTAIESELQRQAVAELGLGDQLSADEARQVRVQSRAAADARGRGFSNAALADEVLNTASARDARSAARRNFALTTNSAVRAGQEANRAYGLARDQFRSGVNQFNSTMGLNAAQLNQADRQFGANLSQNDRQFAAQFGASRADADRGALAQAAGYEQGLGDTAYQRQLGATQARLSTYSDPYMGVLGRTSANVGTNANLFSNAAGTAGTSASSTRSMFDPFNAYAADLYNTNYNAEAAANIATANNRASLIGAGIGTLGMLGGGALAGGYFCWVARAVYGENSPKWTHFRRWLLTRAPQSLLARYTARGAATAARVRREPALRAELRQLMDAVLDLNPQLA